MTKEINFDMDGTIVNLYGVENWLDYLVEKNPLPYMIAEPMLNMSALARVLNRKQKQGYKINIISWLAKNSNEDYDKLVTNAKKSWLKKHLPSVKWDNINIVAYGTPKQNLGKGILFDDEKPNRDNWGKGAYDINDIINVIKGLDK